MLSDQENKTLSKDIPEYNQPQSERHAQKLSAAENGLRHQVYSNECYQRRAEVDRVTLLASILVNDRHKNQQIRRESQPI